jgi:hypothetical protein
VNAEFAGSVAGGTNHAALGRRSADDDRLAALRGIVALLDGSVERIRIGVRNDFRLAARSGSTAKQKAPTAVSCSGDCLHI